MARIEEARVEQDADGRVEKIIIKRPKRGGGFGFGVLVGVILIAGALMAFVFTQGSFQQAAVEADQMAASVERQAGAAVNGVEQAANESSDTLTN